MHLRIVHFNLGLGKRTQAEAIADGVVPAIRLQPGCTLAEYFTDDATGDYGLVVHWQTKQAADNAYTVITPLLTKLLTDANATGTSIHLYDLYQPKG